jgi:hypothetical protein
MARADLIKVYNLPLLPGYGASTVVRSSPAVKSPGGVSMLERMTMAEDMGYNDSYFPSNNEEEQHYGTDPNEYILAHSPPVSPRDLLLSSTSPPRHIDASDQRNSERAHEDAPQSPEDRDREQGSEPSITTAETPDISASFEDEDEEPILAPADREHNLIETGTHMSPDHPGYLEHVPSQALSPDQLHPERDARSEPMIIRQEDAIEHQRAFTGQSQMYKQRQRAKSYSNHNAVAEAVFYSYGVSVFFGFTETQEKEIMEDCLNAGAWSRPQLEDDWEVEECHYVVCRSIFYVGNHTDIQYDRDAEVPRIFNDMFSKSIALYLEYMTDYPSLQIAESSIQAVARTRNRPIDKIVDIRSDNARIPRTYIFLP